MNLAIIGTGNVGSGVLAQLSNNVWQTVFVIDRNLRHAEAAVLDAISANYRLARKIHIGTLDQISAADIIIHAAGIPIPSGKTADDTFPTNAKLIREFLDSVTFKSEAVLILVGSPVDHITRLVCRESKLPRERVLGFGGDLDTNRLRAILVRRNLDSGTAQIVGEHGQRSIPVFSEEQEWETVCEELHKYFPSIVASAGHARNLASGILLARLAENIASGASARHTVCAWHPERKICLTWPHEFKGGVWAPSVLELGAMAREAVDTLVMHIENEI